MHGLDPVYNKIQYYVGCSESSRNFDYKNCIVEDREQCKVVVVGSHLTHVHAKFHRFVISR